MVVHHTGLVVRDLAKNIEIYKKLGYSCVGQTITDFIQNNKVVFLTNEDRTHMLELIAPLNSKSTVYNFQDGYHHICYDVSDDSDFVNQFRTLKIGKVFTGSIVAPAIDDREVVFAMLYNGALVEFIIR